VVRCGDGWGVRDLDFVILGFALFEQIDLGIVVFDEWIDWRIGKR
jgi:hypothetical protein